MKNNEEQRRRRKFQEIIQEMAQSPGAFKNPNKLDKVYKELQFVYKGNSDKVNFRHYYSDIFSELSMLKNQGRELDVISENLDEVYKYCSTKGDLELQKNVRKLLDHTNLEIARINYINAIEKRINVTDEIFGDTVRDINEQLDKADKALNKLRNKMDNSYSDFIAILGIFAGIVLVFFGGTTVFGRAISNIHKVGMLKTTLISLVAGLIVFNIIFMFIYYIAKLLDRNIAATNEWISWRPLFIRFKERYPLVFWFDLLILIGIFLSSIVLFFSKIKILKVGNRTIEQIIFEILTVTYRENKIILLIVGIGILGNILFLMAYCISKLCGVNIGCTVFKTYARWVDWEYDEKKQKYVVKDEIKNIRGFTEEEKAVRCTNRIRTWREIKATFSNVVKVACFRYPYAVLFNVIMIIVFCFFF